ncbi:MAG TPA: histidine--tRNA ligase [Gammaproteobacteria bacterium]|nr:histidine--tRNA ligase [Gammaproteobacteria bacterium]
MAGSIQPVRGMNDVLPDEAPLWDAACTAAAEIFKAYDYRRIRIPALERTELFSRSIGELTDIVEKEMYTFEDRNGDSVTLRPEATAGVVRACLTNGLLHNRQQKLWCSGPMFRREKPQKGRYRQFHQLSVEALGYDEPEIDAELILMSARLWRRLGLGGLTLELNSLGTPESRREYKQVLVEYFSARRDALDADSLRRLERNPLRVLDSKNPAMAEIIADAPLLSEHLDDASRRHFGAVQALLAESNVEYVLNPRLVRGLDYYTRTVFEWVTDRLGAQSAVCSGGRYDGLVEQLGGRPTPAVGWALGIERVVELMQAEDQVPAPARPDVVFVTTGEAARTAGFTIAERLRDLAPQLCVSMGSPGAGFKAQMRRADKSGAEYAVIVGDEELAQGKLGFKPLRREEPQGSLAFEELAARLAAEAKRPE